MSDPAVTEPDVPVASPPAADQSNEQLPWRRLVRYAAFALALFTVAGAAAVLFLRAQLGSLSDDRAIAGKQVHDEQLGIVEPRLIELETRAQVLAATRRAQLDHWSWVDRDKNLVRMPIERAMQLVAEGKRMILSLLLAASPLGAQVDWPKPDALEGVGVVENLNERPPLELVFTNHDGKRLRFGDLLQGDLPLVVTPVYYGCPTLCPLTLQGVVGALKATGLRLDEDYRIITYSIDPADTPEAAAARRLDLIHALGFASGRGGWDFLTGDEANTRELSHALGFQYRWVEEAKQWSHSAAFMVLTPDGRISRYLYGVQYPPRDLRLSLVEASGGRVGTTFDRVLLTCFRFDPAARGYQFWVKGAVRVIGLATFFALLALMTVLWRRELARARRA